MSKTKKSKKKKWFKKGAFSDGYQFGDLTKTIIGTAADVNKNINTAILDATENLMDTAAYGVGVVGGLFDDDFQDNVGDFIAKETLKPEKWGKAITNYADPVGWTNLLINGGKTEENSILGEKSDEIVQSIAHMAGSKALGAITPALTPISAGVNAFGSEIEQAYQQDATHFEAGLSGLINAGAEIMFEKLSSGIELLKGTSADETAVRWLSTKVSNKLIRTLMKFGMDVTGEGAEEVLTEVASSVGRKLTYLSENEWNEILSAEDLWDAFIGGVLMGGGFSGFDIVKSKTQGIDPTSKLTETEENNVNDTYKASVSNEKLKPSEKNKIYASLKDRTIRNRASIDDINKSFSKEEQNLYKGIEGNDVKQLDEEISETLAADKENINGKLEGHNNYINPKAFIEGLWEGSRKSKSDENAKNVEKSQLESVENIEESSIIKKRVGNDTGVPGEYKYTIKWQNRNIPVRKAGEGHRGPRSNQHNERVNNYELKINPNNESFFLEHPNGKMIQFEDMKDGVVKDGKLIMKNNSIYFVKEKPKFLNTPILVQAKRQLEAANLWGYRVEWLVSDQRAVEQMRQLFNENDLDIIVTYYPE